MNDDESFFAASQGQAFREEKVFLEKYEITETNIIGLLVNMNLIMLSGLGLENRGN